MNLQSNTLFGPSRAIIARSLKKFANQKQTLWVEVILEANIGYCMSMLEV
jgi:hypothetical protein